MNEYWSGRNETLKSIQETLKTDEDYKKELGRIYSTAQLNIQKEIDSELLRYAGSENLSLSDAKSRIDKIEVESFQNKLETYKDLNNLSPQGLELLERYNVKIRTNRLQLLDRNIELETIALADKEDELLKSKLTKEIGDEYRKQAGILGETVPSPEQLNRLSKTLIEADYKGTNFSNRIWANQKELQDGLEQVIERTLIQGKNPREGARDLRGLVNKAIKSKRYAAERIAITESARIQDQTQRKAFDEYGIKEYEWVAEPDACEECAGYNGQIFKLNDSYAPAVPAHPFCRCSAAAHLDRDSLDKGIADVIKELRR